MSARVMAHWSGAQLSQHLLDTIGILANALAHLLVHLVLVLFAGALDEEVSRIHLNHLRQELVIVHVCAVSRIAVSAGASMDADIRSLLWAEPVEHAVVQIDEGLKELCACPGIAWIVSSRETAFGEVDGDSFRASFETLTDVFLAFFDQIVFKLLLGVPFYFSLQRVDQVHQGWCNDGLLHAALLGIRQATLEVVCCVVEILEWPRSQTRQLAVVAVCEDREVLAIGFEVAGQPGA